MPIKSKFIKPVLFCALLAAGAAAFAQESGEISEKDYRKMLQETLNSGNYGQNQNQSQSWDARVKVVSGTVMVKTVEGDEWSKITGEMPLDPNDVVKTSADGVAEIYFDDKGAMALGRNTELEITALEQEDAIFALNSGSLVAKIRHFLNEKHKMQVRTPSAVCAIRGTEFAVEYSQQAKEASMAVFDEGRVAATPAGDSGKDAQEYILEKNTEIRFSPATKRFRVTPLSGMGRHRGVLGTMRARLTALKGWKPRSLSRRAELRGLALKGKIIRKQLKERTGKSRAVKRGAKTRGAAKRVKARQPPAEDEE